jgi:hypothetical protein
MRPGLPLADPLLEAVRLPTPARLWGWGRVALELIALAWVGYMLAGGLMTWGPAVARLASR